MRRGKGFRAAGPTAKPPIPVVTTMPPSLPPSSFNTADACPIPTDTIAHFGDNMVTEIQSPYLTTDEAIKYLRMDHLRRARMAIQRLVLRKKLIAYRRGKDYLFTKEGCDRYLAVQVKGKR